MEQPYLLADQQERVRLLQLSDMHLFENEDDALLGVNTYQSLKTVLATTRIHDLKFDGVLATGDLIQDNQLAGYDHFAQLTRGCPCPIFWLTGNHDEPNAMQQKLAHYPHIQPHKQIFAGKYWQILMLDSQVFGVPHGELSSFQLDWLASQLQAHTDLHTLIVLHHNLLPTHSAWLDQHSLRNAGELADTIKPFHNVKGFLHGHIHQEVDDFWQGYRVLACPSTSIQFKPYCNAFTLDNLAQGWRELTLLPNGEIETYVKRIDRAFLPNFSSQGY